MKSRSSGPTVSDAVVVQPRVISISLSFHLLFCVMHVCRGGGGPIDRCHVRQRYFAQVFKVTLALTSTSNKTVGMTIASLIVAAIRPPPPAEGGALRCLVNGTSLGSVSGMGSLIEFCCAYRQRHTGQSRKISCPSYIL